MNVYWTSIEYKYGEKSTDNIVGGFVYAFVKAPDEKIALSKVEAELIAEDMFTVEVEFVERYDEFMEWESEQNAEHFKELYRRAELTAEVVFDDFYSYENGDE